jgi:antibiotic biosynthesis monooxygenase (ABM) superfamily enzyme
MGENIEESKPHKKKKNWKALLLGVGAFLLFKAFGVLKLLIMPLLKIFGIGHLLSFDDFDIVIFVHYFLIAETIFF